jgi:hypothetical protein
MQSLLPGQLLNDELKLTDELPVAAGVPYRMWLAIDTRTSVSLFVKVFPDGSFEPIQQDQLDQLPEEEVTPSVSPLNTKRQSKTQSTPKTNGRSAALELGGNKKLISGIIILLMLTIVWFFFSTDEAEKEELQAEKKSVNNPIPQKSLPKSTPAKVLPTPAPVSPAIVSKQPEVATVDSTAVANTETLTQVDHPPVVKLPASHKRKVNPARKKSTRSTKDLFLPDPELNRQ